MKKVLLMLAVIGCISLSACQKEELSTPDNQSLKVDKGMDCRGCGQWDIVSPDSGEGASALRIVTTDAPTTPTKAKKTKK